MLTPILWILLLQTPTATATPTPTPTPGEPLVVPITDEAPIPSPRKWAVRVTRPGLPNFHQVSQDLYRGAQPEGEQGYRELAALGIKTVVSLRSFRNDRAVAEAAKLGYEQIGMTSWTPQKHEVARFLRIVGDPSKHPVFVHCQHGADRTGAMTAIYRIAVQDWSKDEAIREMTEGGFGFHLVWKDLVKYVRDLEVAELRSATATKRLEP